MAASVTTVVSLTAAATVPVILALGKFAGLRDSTYTKWNARVDLAYAGLSERAVDLLRRLQKETDAVLGTPKQFDPVAALSDPAALARIASNFQRTIRVRRLLPRRFKILVRLAIAAPILAVVYVIAAWAVAANYAEWWQPGWLPEAGFVVGGVCMCLGLLLVLTFYYLEWTLTSADIMSQKADSPGKLKGA